MRGGPAAPLCLAIYRKDAELLGELLGQGLEDDRCEKSLPLIVHDGTTLGLMKF